MSVAGCAAVVNLEHSLTAAIAPPLLGFPHLREALLALFCWVLNSFCSESHAHHFLR
jgi:hypothetical protein